MIKFKNVLFVVLVSMILSSCSLLQPNRMFKTDYDFQFDDFDSVNEKEYKLQPYDDISLSVSTNLGNKLINPIEDPRGNSKMQVHYMIEFDGLVKLPTLGRVKLEGLTLREAEKFLEKEYGNYLQDPFVLLKVNNRKVYIFKSGGQAGSVITIPESRLTLIEALAMSGGIPDGDKAYKIKLIRGDVSSTPKVFKYDVSSLEDIQGSNLQLKANDIIYIDCRPRYVKRLLLELSPYLSLLSTIILIQKLF